MEKKLTLENFHFELPDHFIAQKPKQDRSEAKLLVRKSHGDIIHSHVHSLADAFKQPCLFIVNDSKVIPARLFGQTSTGAKIEFLLLRCDPRTQTWEAMAKPKKRLRENQIVAFTEELSAEIISLQGQSPQSCRIRFNLGSDKLYTWLEKNGQMPVPPYIKRNQGDAASELLQMDKDRYQTVFAKESGSVAAPTASLHFDANLLKQLFNTGFDFAGVTLHVGAGTFLPITANDLNSHHMHQELFYVPKETLKKIMRAKEIGQPIVAVGTTTLRTLESFHKFFGDSAEKERHVDQWHDTDLFIYPETDQDRYQPWCIDALMTNFHQPGSTLFLLISALIGRQAALSLYQEAKAKEYRFLSYGDSSLLWLS